MPAWWRIVIWGRWRTCQTGTLDPQAQVRLLAQQEEALVEQPGARQRLTTREQEGAGRPVALVLALVRVPIELTCRPTTPDAPATLGAQRLAERAADGGKAVDRRAPRSVGLEMAHAGHADLWFGVEHGEQLAEGPVDHLGVGIEQQ